MYFTWYSFIRKYRHKVIWICVKLDLKISLFFVESDSNSHLHLDLNQQMLRLSCILNTKPEIDQIWNGVYLAEEYFVSCIPLHLFYTRKCVFLTKNMTVVRSLGKLSGSPPVASDQLGYCYRCLYWFQVNV